MIDYVNRYADEYYAQNDDIQNLYDTEKEEITTIHNDLKLINNNMFINTSDLETVNKWEKVLGIKYDTDHTLEQRRDYILNKLLFKPPFTRQRFYEILESIWGEGNYTFEVYPNEFRVVIDIYTNDPVIYLQFQNLVRRYVPANMYLVFSIQYTHMFLSRNYTYEKLNANFTYEELSKYANDTSLQSD